MVEPPPLVRQATALADELGFTRSCIHQVGRLLHVLAGQRGRFRVGEIGTGCGVGAAWIVSALSPEVPFVTVELDGERASAAGRFFAEDPNVRILAGDWHELMPAEAPFDLLFYDGGASSGRISTAKRSSSSSPPAAPSSSTISRPAGPAPIRYERSGSGTTGSQPSNS